MDKVDCEDIIVPSGKYGDINVLTAGNKSSENSVVFLHGCPSDSRAIQKQFPAFIYMNYRCYSIDFPGYGKSKGEKLPSRSELIMNDKGPADVVRLVMKHFGLNKPVLSGYDWGGAIALKMGVNDSKSFSKIIAFHPSYNEEKKDELKNLKTPTLIQWNKND